MAGAACWPIRKGPEGHPPPPPAEQSPQDGATRRRVSPQDFTESLDLGPAGGPPSPRGKHLHISTFPGARKRMTRLADTGGKSPWLRVRFCPVGNDARTNGTRETRGGRALPAEVTGALDRRSGSAPRLGRLPVPARCHVDAAPRSPPRMKPQGALPPPRQRLSKSPC